MSTDARPPPRVDASTNHPTQADEPRGASITSALVLAFALWCCTNVLGLVVLGRNWPVASVLVQAVAAAISGVISFAVMRAGSRASRALLIALSASGLGLLGVFAYMSGETARKDRLGLRDEIAREKAEQETNRAGTIPEFPWPPPAASASYVLPRNLFEPNATVGQVADAIVVALEQQGYVERSFFRNKDQGVVLVTRRERINEDGSPAAERWPADWQQRDLARLLLGLFYIDAGHYRVIAFVLQDTPFAQSADRPTGEEAREWLGSGANVLPAELANRPYGTCTALIYEFASDGRAVRLVATRITGKEHLEKAGVLAVLASPK